MASKHTIEIETTERRTTSSSSKKSGDAQLKKEQKAQEKIQKDEERSRKKTDREKEQSRKKAASSAAKSARERRGQERVQERERKATVREAERDQAKQEKEQARIHRETLRQSKEKRQIQRDFINDFFGTIGHSRTGYRINRGIDFVNQIIGKRGNQQTSTGATDNLLGRGSRASGLGMGNKYGGMPGINPNAGTRTNPSGTTTRSTGRSSPGGPASQARKPTHLKTVAPPTAAGGASGAGAAGVGALGAAGAIAGGAGAVLGVAILAAGTAFIVGAKMGGKAASKMAEDIDKAGAFSAATFAKMENELKLFALNMQRGQKYGSQLAGIERTKGNISRQIINIKDKFTEALLPVAQKALELFERLLAFLEPGLNEIAKFTGDMFGTLLAIIELLEDIHNWLVDNTFMGYFLERIEKNTRKKKDVDRFSEAGIAVALEGFLQLAKAGTDRVGFDTDFFNNPAFGGAGP